MMLNFFRSFPLVSYTIDEDKNDRIIMVDYNRQVKAYIENLDNSLAYQYFDIKDGSRPDQVSTLLYQTPNYFWTFFAINPGLSPGLSAWPKSQSELENYVDEKYPRVSLTSISISDSNAVSHHLYNKNFQVGETVVGVISGASGTIDQIDSMMNRLLLTNVEGTFINEGIIGQTSGSTLPSVTNSYKVVVQFEKDAAHHYVNSSGDEQHMLRFFEGENLIPVSNFEYEDQVNDSRTRIKIINPGLIDQFSTQYKKLINDGNLVNS